VENAGAAAARNCEVVGLPAPDEFKGSTAHVTDYEDRFGEAPGAMSPYAYDSLNVLAHGVEQAGGFETDALTAALNKVSGLQGWTGPIALEQGTGKSRAHNGDCRRGGRARRLERRSLLGEGIWRALLNAAPAEQRLRLAGGLG
jgi:hypothetical protein